MLWEILLKVISQQTTHGTSSFPYIPLFSTTDYRKKQQYIRRFFRNSYIRNSMVSENKVIVFTFLNKKKRKEIIFSWWERIKIFAIKFSTLNKKLKSIIFVLFIFRFFPNIFCTLICYSSMAFQQYQIYYFFFHIFNKL